jgi:hypothetical protein
VDEVAVWVEAERFAGLAREDLDLWRETVGATVEPRDPRRGQGRILAVHWGRTHAAEPARVILRVQYSSGVSARLSAMQLPRVIRRLRVRPPLARLLGAPEISCDRTEEIPEHVVAAFRAEVRGRQDQAIRDRSRSLAERVRRRRVSRDRRRRIALWHPWRRRQRER